ncbi:MAG: hypothetical protein IPN76_16160 [Saprospiraceae bacterium]|nr:hypothetical protein [Saprospiraceae bacterium]
MKSIYSLIISLFCYQVLLAQWEPTIGPFGGDILDLKKNDSYLFASTYNGLFRSADGGHNWSKLSITPNGISTYGLGINGNSLVVVGYEEWGIYLPLLFKSDDNGNNWYQLNLPDTLEFVDIAVTDFAIYVLGNHNLIFTTDGGQNWQNSAVNSSEAYPWTITSFNQSVYIGGGAKIYRSAVDGDTWTALPIPGMTTGVDILQVLDEVIFARGGTNALFVSSDSGQTWQKSQTTNWSNGWPNFVKIGDTYYENEIYIVRKSIDVGNTWSNVLNNDNISTYRMINYGEELMVGSFDQGILRSTDFGHSFHPSNKGLDASNPRHLAIGNGKLLAGCDYIGFFQYDIGQAVWDTTIYYPIKFDFGDIAAIQDKIFVTNDFGKIVRSDDGGLNWEDITPDESAFSFNFENLTVDTDTLYATGNWVAGSNVPLHKSKDFGQSWELIEIQVNGVDYWPIFFARNEDYLFMADVYNVFRSSDSGQTWEIINQSMALAFPARIYDLTVANNLLFVILHDGAYNRLYISPNSSDQWQLADSGISLNNFLGGVGNIISVGGVLVASTISHVDGLFVSYDNAITWQPFNDGPFRAEAEK